MNTADSAATARIAAWNVIAEQELPAGTKVTVKDGEVTIQSPGGQPARVSYDSADGLASLCDALKSAVQATTRDAR